MDCVFCNIVKGNIDAVKIFEDNEVLVFLDANPIAKGHCLVIPKLHYENVFVIDAEVLKKIIIVGKNITDKLQKSLGASGANFIHASGKDAEQSIFHFHLHVVPRYEHDLLNMHEWWKIKENKATDDELRKLGEQIKSEM